MNRHSVAFVHGLIREISLADNNDRLGQVLQLAKDVRSAIQSKDFNGVSSYKNFYLLLKGANDRDQLVSDIASGSSDQIVTLLVQNIGDLSALTNIQAFGTNVLTTA